MTTRLATLVFLAAGGLVIIGTLRAIFAQAQAAPGNVTVAFEASSQPSQPAAEPLFPGLPSR